MEQKLAVLVVQMLGDQARRLRYLRDEANYELAPVIVTTGEYGYRRRPPAW